MHRIKTRWRASKAVRKHMAWGLMLVFLAMGQAEAQTRIHVAKGSVVFEENGKNRRLLIEPGTLLTVLGRETSFTHGSLYKVLTPTGIEGTMQEKDVVVFERVPDDIAFVKKKLRRGNIHLIPGDMHPFVRTDDSDETVFEIDIGVAKYEVERGAYSIRYKKLKMAPREFDEYFNVITADKLSHTPFLRWRQVTKNGKKVSQSWGCGESSKVIDFLKAGVDTSVGAGGSFWGWFSAKFSAYLKGGRDQTWTIDKRDEKHQHKLSFWNLEDEAGKVLLKLVIDRIRECPPASSNKINYEFSFPGNEIDAFEINHNWVAEWVEKKKYNYVGEVVPLTLATLEDYRKLEEIITRSGYLKFDAHLPYAAHVRDQIVRIAAAVLKPPGK